MSSSMTQNPRYGQNSISMNNNSGRYGNQSPPHLEKSQVQFSRTENLQNGSPKKRSRSYWNYRTIHAQDKQRKSQGITRNTILQDLKKESNPFLMGGVRKDKFRFQGGSTADAASRLNNYWTIQRGNSSCQARPPTDLSLRVKPLPNLYNNCRGSDIVQDIIQNSEIFEQKPEMLDSIAKLKDMKLLSSNYMQNTRTLGKKNRIPYTYNDYHSKQTNNGFARTSMGCFYTR